jgi:hypothetical protein
MRAVIAHRSIQLNLWQVLLALAAFLAVAAMPLHSQTLRGQVVDSVENQPLAGINAVLLDAERDTVAVTRTGADGRFAFSVPAGAYTLCLRCIGHRPKQLPVVVPADNAIVVALSPLRIPPAR